jgi:hypothetical protein
MDKAASPVCRTFCNRSVDDPHPEVGSGSSAAVSIISPLGQVSLTQQTYPKVNALGGPGAGSLAFNPSPPHAVGALFNLAELLCDNQGENAYASLENVQAIER